MITRSGKLDINGLEFVNNSFDVKGKIAAITGAIAALEKDLALGYGFAGIKVFVKI